MDDDWFPARPCLAPGARVVRRDDGGRQVGFAPDRRVLLPHGRAADAFVDDLLAGRRPDLGSPGPRGWARDLVARGLVVDTPEVARALRQGAPREAARAALARTGAAATDRLGSRARARVAVVADGTRLDDCHALLEEAGLRAAGPRSAPSVQLVVSLTGEPDRSLLDPAMRTGLPHLLVTNVAARLTVGPFVAPGLTACRRCVDAHGSDRDPGHALVVEQHRPDPTEPADPLLVRLALAWAVRDLVAYVEGDPPSTWSATVDLDDSLRPRRQEWSRHPRCGCSWGEALGVG